MTTQNITTFVEFLFFMNHTLEVLILTFGGRCFFKIIIELRMLLKLGQAFKPKNTIYKYIYFVCKKSFSNFRTRKRHIFHHFIILCYFLFRNIFFEVKMVFKFNIEFFSSIVLAVVFLFLKGFHHHEDTKFGR